MRPIVFLDTETDSLGPDRQVWEVAMIRRDEEGDHEINFFLPIRESRADLISLNIGGYYQRHPWAADPRKVRVATSYVKQGEVADPWEAATLIQNWTGEGDAIIVGAVPNFDTEVLGKFLRKRGFLPRWHYHLIDIENLALGWLANTDWFNPSDWISGGMKSDDLSRACGVAPPSDEERHTALGDARWAMRWYDVIMGPVS